MHIIRLFFMFVTHQFISCFRFTLNAIPLEDFLKFLKVETCQRAWVLLFFSRLLAPLWNLIFSQFLKPTTDELVVGCQYMTYDRLCLEYFHRGLQLLESSNKQIYVIYGLITGHWQVLVCLDGCWSTPIDLLYHRHHTSPLLVEKEIMQDCTTPYHPQYCTTPYHPQNTQFFHTTQKYT